MGEWATYSPSDFLLFAPRTYYRLFELYNAAVWPAQLAALSAGAAILALLRRGGTVDARIAAALLAACWLWVAVAFHAQRYATINWAAEWFAWAFAAEAALLLALGVLRNGFASGSRSGPGFGLFAFALLLQPLLGPLFGRDWRQMELFGLAPDPTALATLGALALVGGRARWALAALPLLWCAISGATLWTMGAPDALVLPAAGALGLLALARLRPR